MTRKKTLATSLVSLSTGLAAGSVHGRRRNGCSCKDAGRRPAAGHQHRRSPIVNHGANTGRPSACGPPFPARSWPTRQLPARSLRRPVSSGLQTSMERAPAPRSRARPAKASRSRCITTTPPSNTSARSSSPWAAPTTSAPATRWPPQQEHRLHGRPLRQRGPGRLRHELRLCSGLRRRYGALRKMAGQGTVRSDAVEQVAEHPVRHGIRRGLPSSTARSLADVVGAIRRRSSTSRAGLTYKSFGYPAAVPFTGQTLVSCTGKAGNDAINPQFKTQGIPCDMTGGSSGGPVVHSGGTARASLGYQNSVNSYGYGTPLHHDVRTVLGTGHREGLQLASAAK